MYFDKLIEANSFNKKIGLNSLEISKPTENKYLENPEFFPQLGKYLNINEPHELVANCNIVSEVIRDVIEKEIGCKAYLTIGDVIIDQKPFFNIDPEYITSVIKTGEKSLYPQKYHHHAWITLDSMEILDFTFNTSLALLSKNLSEDMRMQLLGGVLSGHPDYLKHGVTYNPVVLGEEFYQKYDSVYSEYKQIYINQLASKENGFNTQFIKQNNT